MLLWKCCNLCTYYVLAFPITNLHFIFSVSKWSRSWRERKSGKKSFTKRIKEFVWRLYIKFSCQVLILKSFHQDFVQSFHIKSLYQVFVSSLCIKSSYQVFVSSLRIKSKWWNKHFSETMLRSSRCFVILLLCFSLGVKKYLF